MEDLLEKQCLLAEFMGAEVLQAYPESKDQNGKLFYFSKNSPDMYKNISSNSLKYHTSWDWQIEVWSKVIMLLREKAERYKFDHDDYERFINKFDSATFGNDKEEGFNTLVEAVKKLNELNEN